jgi:hypothetical protein
MGTKLVGIVRLENGQTVFVTWLERPMGDALLHNVERFRSARVLDSDGNPIHNVGMLAFGREPNLDANDGTQVGVLLDVTRTRDQ